jgi:hypothetical protein
VKKSFFIFALLFVAATSTAQSFPPYQTKALSRASKKAAHKAQKDMIKYSKQQQKAMKKSATAQWKALQKAQGRNRPY